MNERSLRLTEVWFRLLSEAARGTREAQQTLRSLTEDGLTPEKLARRLAKLLPAGVAAPNARTLAQWGESFWAATGVVPRARYLELLERYEALRARLEEAEVTIQKLKRLVGDKGHEIDAQKALDLFATTVADTLKAQTEWMRSWIPRPPEWQRPEPAESEKPPANGPKPAKRRRARAAAENERRASPPGRTFSTKR